MAYEIAATRSTPALVLYLIDVSASMSLPLGDKRRIDVVSEALFATVKQMVFRSTKGKTVSARYRLGMLAYSDKVYDLLHGVRGVDEVAQKGIPTLTPLKTTFAAKGFAQVEKILQEEIGQLGHCPAPLICHITDGEYNGEDPGPIVDRLRAMQVADGNVLVENVFISEKILPEPIVDVERWPGIRPESRLEDPYALKLRAMSSPIPESYRMMMQEMNYHLEPGAVMMIPGTNPDLVALGLAMSGATAVS